MIVEYVRYELKESRPEALVEAYRVAAEQLRAAPECLGYELTRCEEAPMSFILRIQWVSTDAHLNGFRKGPHFPPFLAAIRPFIPEIAEMRHYQPTGLDWSRSGGEP
jgi:quinol monooxygenase YgiN